MDTSNMGLRYLLKAAVDAHIGKALGGAPVSGSYAELEVGGETYVVSGYLGLNFSLARFEREADYSFGGKSFFALVLLQDGAVSDPIFTLFDLARQAQHFTPFQAWDGTPHSLLKRSPDVEIG